MAEEIVIEIGVDGAVRLEVNGVAGTRCRDLTKAIEAGLGEVEHRAAKPELRQAAATVRARPAGR